MDETALRHLAGPFDIIGDVHGCYEELCSLLSRLGWSFTPGGGASHPGGRTAIFLGDLVDRGPGIVQTLKLAIAMVEEGHAICLLGNHDDKLMRKLEGRKVRVANGLEDTLAQLEGEPAGFVLRVRDFLRGLTTYRLLDGGRLVVAHAGIKESMIGRSGEKVRAFTIYGDTTGETDEHGLPVRLDWAAGYRGDPAVVYGHTPVREARWRNNTINIDTGCVFGGTLTALRYPERELVSVPALAQYAHRAVWQ